MPLALLATRLFSTYTWVGEASAAYEEEESDSNERFAKKDYWNQRFAKETSYEWLASLSTFAADPFVRAALLAEATPPRRVLVVGCGNSSLSHDLYEFYRGRAEIISIDYSSIVVESMSKKYPHLTFLEMDMTKPLTPRLEAASFDLCVDKAAMDALVVTEGDPWDPSEECKANIDAYAAAVAEVLRPEGTFLLLGLQPGHFRRRHFERTGDLWNTMRSKEVESVKSGGIYVAFELTKKA